jgi:hypothetical protein
VPPYSGLDTLDPTERASKRALTLALWEKLNEQGVGVGSTGRIEAIFFAPTDDAANALVTRYARASGWETERVPAGDHAGDVVVHVRTPVSRFTRDAFLELSDIMMVEARATGCVFDGLLVEVSAVKRKPWWRFW